MPEILSQRQIQTYTENFPAGKSRIHSLNLESLEHEMGCAEDTFINTYLSPEERKRFCSFKYRKRQIEWLGGRLAAKKAIGSLLLEIGHAPPSPAELFIDSTPEGRPLLNTAKIHLPIDISISHSANIATAMAAANGLCGIDIQKITQTIRKVKSRFASAKEEHILQQADVLGNYDNNFRLAMLWSAKEVFRKGILLKPLLGFLEVSLESLNGSVERGFIGCFKCNHPGNKKELKAFMTVYKKYAVALMHNSSDTT